MLRFIKFSCIALLIAVLPLKVNLVKQPCGQLVPDSLLQLEDHSGKKIVPLLDREVSLAAVPAKICLLSAGGTAELGQAVSLKSLLMLLIAVLFAMRLLLEKNGSRVPAGF